MIGFVILVVVGIALAQFLAHRPDPATRIERRTDPSPKHLAAYFDWSALDHLSEKERHGGRDF